MHIPNVDVMAFRATSKGEFSNTAIYSIPAQDGLPAKAGLYRRVSREGRIGIEAPEGNVVVMAPKGTRNGKPTTVLSEVQRWTEGEEMINKALAINVPPSIEKPF